MWHIRWFIPVILVGYIFYQAFWADGSLVAFTDFRERTPYFDVLLPAGRVERMPDGIIIQQEPVYIDVRAPIRAKRVVLELVIEENSAPINIGLQTGVEFAFDFGQQEIIKLSDGLLHYRYEVEGINYVRQGNKVRFIISAPGMEPGTVLVKSARVSLGRQRAGSEWWLRIIKQLWS